MLCVIRPYGIVVKHFIILCYNNWNNTTYSVRKAICRDKHTILSASLYKACAFLIIMCLCIDFFSIL